MPTGEGRRTRGARAGLVLLAALLAQAALPGTSRAATIEVYTLGGYEVWFTPTVATFVGTGTGASGGLSAWYTSIEHSVVISPSGVISGGWATLQRTDGVRLTGRFSGGTVTMTYDGPGCTNESHHVLGAMSAISRSDRSGEAGAGFFNATLIHYRGWIFGRCLTYSASVHGTMSIAS